MKLGVVDYVRDPTSHDNFGGDGIALCGWSEHMRDLSHLSVFFFFSLANMIRK